MCGCAATAVTAASAIGARSRAMCEGSARVRLDSHVRLNDRVRACTRPRVHRAAVPGQGMDLRGRALRHGERARALEPRRPSLSPLQRHAGAELLARAHRAL